MGVRTDVMDGDGAGKRTRPCRRVGLLAVLGLCAALAVHGTLTDVEDARGVLNVWQWLMLPQERRVWEDAGEWRCAPCGELAALAFGGALSNSVSVYAYEDADTRETVIAAADGTPLAVLPPLAGYSPFWACGLAGVAAESPGDFDPSRVGVRIGLVATDVEAAKSIVHAVGGAAAFAATTAASDASAIPLAAVAETSAVQGASSSAAAISSEADAEAAVRVALPTNLATSASVPSLEGVRARSLASGSASLLSSDGADVSEETGTTAVPRSVVRADVVRTRTVCSLPLAPEGLELYYDFAADIGNGAVADASWNGRDGASSECVWTNAGRFAGGAFAFAGNGSGVNAGTGLDFPRWSEYTVSVWFLYDGGGDVGPQYGIKMVDKTSFFHDWHLSLHPVGHDQDTGSVGLTLYENGVSRSLADETRDWGDGQWHHAVVVRRGTRGELWMDGVLGAVTDGMVDVASSSALCVGNSYSDDEYQRRGWSGLLDEVAVFGRALSTNEIVSLHAEGVPAGMESDVAFATNAVFCGGVSFAGDAMFGAGVRLLRPQGDLSFGIYTNGAPANAD